MQQTHSVLLAIALLFFGCHGGDDGAGGEPGACPPAYEDAYPEQGWPAVHGDSRNSDTSEAVGARDLELGFNRLAGDIQGLAPSVGPEGNLYATTLYGPSTARTGCHLYALDGRTGERLWCSDRLNDRAVASQPLVDRDENLYVGDNRAMHSFTRDGEHRWERPIEGFPLSAQFTPDGRLLFITHIGRIYVLDRRDGTPVIDGYRMLDVTYEPRPFDYLDCFTGSSEGSCYCANTPAVDLDTGNFFFTLTDPGDLDDDGVPRTRLVAMRYTVCPEPRIDFLWETGADNGLVGGSATSPALSADGTRIYVNDNAGNLHALNACDGTAAWSEPYPLGFVPVGSPSVSREGLIIPQASFDAGRLTAIADMGDHGQMAWSIDGLVSRGITAQAEGGLAYATVGRGSDEEGPALFGIDMVVIDTRPGVEFERPGDRVLDRVRITDHDVGVGSTSISAEGRVYVSGFVAGIFSLLPAPRSAVPANREERGRTAGAIPAPPAGIPRSAHPRARIRR